ncbi:MAG: NAD(P)H-dependent oxidoreductase [Candidatus Woesearchaeota archaeon]
MYTIIIAHPPNTQSHCRYMFTQLQQKLGQAHIIDLYADTYNPLYDESDDVLTKKYKAYIKESDKLIFIYPVWWNGPPAVMKGFFDRVMSQKFAFKYVQVPFLGFGRPVGLLQGKKAVVITTSGSPNWIHTLFQQRRAGLNATFDVLHFCGIKAKLYHLGNARPSHYQKNMVKMQTLVKKTLRYLK